MRTKNTNPCHSPARTKGPFTQTLEGPSALNLALTAHLAAPCAATSSSLRGAGSAWAFCPSPSSTDGRINTAIPGTVAIHQLARRFVKVKPLDDKFAGKAMPSSTVLGLPSVISVNHCSENCSNVRLVMVDANAMRLILTLLRISWCCSRRECEGG